MEKYGIRVPQSILKTPIKSCIMLKNRNIICIANTSWYGKYTKSTVQLMGRLAKDNNVLFVEHAYTYKDIFSAILKKQEAPILKMLGIKKRLEHFFTKDGDKIYNLTAPPVLPLYFLKNESLFKFLFKINAHLYLKSLKKAIRKLEFKNPIVITAFNPFYGLATIGKLSEESHIYYCYDAVESWFFGDRIFKTEEELMEKADMIITTSESLHIIKSRFNSNCHIVKNGVDFPEFNKFSKKEPVIRDKKIVGYIGSLDFRFDIDKVEEAIKLLSQYIFKFTGDLRNKAIKERLEKYPNVEFYPPIDPLDVPQLLSTYDVGIIPYLVNDANKNIYPLKINEFLAVGVPVVMTPFADLKEFSEIVSISSDINSLDKMIQLEIENDSKEKIEQRVEFAKANSWDSRAELFSSIISLNK